MLKHNWKDNLLVLDGDLVAFRACAVSVKTTVWPSTTGDPDDEQVTAELDTVSARNYFECTVNRVLGMGERLVVALSDPTNFRKTMFTEYKANRADKAPPLGLGWLRKWVKKTYLYDQMPGIEADDLLGMYASAPGSHCIVCSDDKDIRSIPGVFRRLTGDSNSPLSKPVDEIISQDLADWRHMYQTLVGDTADGYPGCPGIGDVTATKILGEPGTKPLAALWPLVVATFKKKGLQESDALRQARMARILRFGEYARTGEGPGDFRVTVWEAPK